MIVFLLGDNSVILQSLVQTLSGLETRMVVNPDALFQNIQQIDHSEPFLLLFDINHPVKHFELLAEQVKTKFPAARIWAIFDSSSQSLHKELMRLGFEKIISYEDNIGQIIQNQNGFK